MVFAIHWHESAMDLHVFPWRRLLRVSWASGKSNQSILKGVSPEYSFKDWCWSWNANTSHLMQRTDSLEKTLILGKIEGRRKRGWQRMRWFDGFTDSMDMSLSKLWEFGDGQRSLCAVGPWGHKELNMTEQLNWTELKEPRLYLHCYLQDPLV